MVALTHEVRSAMFIPGEVVPWNNCLTSVKTGNRILGLAWDSHTHANTPRGTGVASRKGRVILEGSFWGDDFILATNSLKDMAEARALTYAEILFLDRDMLFEILEDFPQEHSKIRNQIQKMAAARGVLRAAKVIKKLQVIFVDCPYSEYHLWRMVMGQTLTLLLITYKPHNHQNNPNADMVASSNGVLAESFNYNGDANGDANARSDTKEPQWSPGLEVADIGAIHGG